MLQYGSAFALQQQPGLSENRWDYPCNIPPYEVSFETKQAASGQISGSYLLSCRPKPAPDPPSTFDGEITNVQFTCLGGSGPIWLLSGGGSNSSYYFRPSVGQSYFYPESTPKTGGVPVADAVVVNCGPQPSGPDSDGDGCPDAREQGPSELTGGRRNYLNPWDYFNPTLDGLNRVDDILRVVLQFFDDDNDGSPGQPPYSAGYDPGTDRTLMGPNAWNLGPPNGQQRADDIIHIVRQFFHDCS